MITILFLGLSAISWKLPRGATAIYGTDIDLVYNQAIDIIVTRLSINCYTLREPWIIDLSDEGCVNTEDRKVIRVAKPKLISFTGASISKESGLDTFENFDRNKMSRSFADEFPEEYNAMIADFRSKIEKAQPNDAHFALAEYGIPIITMNFDDLHEKAGSKDGILHVHGVLPYSKEELENASLLVGKPVLYGDIAPRYSRALGMLIDYDKMLVCGASDYTGFANDIREIGCETLEVIDNINSRDLRKYIEEEFGWREKFEECFMEVLKKKDYENYKFVMENNISTIVLDGKKEKF